MIFRHAGIDVIVVFIDEEVCYSLTKEEDTTRNIYTTQSDKIGIQTITSTAKGTRTKLI